MLLSVGAGACGGADKGMGSASHISSIAAASGSATATTASHTMPAGRYLNDGDNDPSNDNDLDDRNGHNTDEDNDSPEDHFNPLNDRYHDKDDKDIVAYGHEASAADSRAVTALVRRYYAAAVAGDGAKACSMIVSSLVEAIPEDYGHGSAGPSYLRAGKTCRAVTSLLFKHFHSQLIGTFEVTGVRVEGNRSYALLGSTTMPAGEITLQREHGAWKVDALLGGPLP